MKIDRFEIELDESYDVVVERLIGQNGLCRDTVGMWDELYFECFKNGKFCITSGPSHARKKALPYLLVGKIKPNGEKTRISASIDYMSMSGFFIAQIFIIIALVALYFWIGSSLAEPTLPLILVTLLFVAVTVLAIVREKKIKPKTGEELPEIVKVMKSEVLKRIEAVKLWDK